MKSKAPLVMMEQIVMVLIFALAAALCLQTFVLSGKISNKTKEKNSAVILAQNVAETMKQSGLSGCLERYNPAWEDKGGKLYFDADRNLIAGEESATFILTVTYEEPEALPVWQAEISCATAEGEELVRLSVAGQTEVAENE